MKFPQLTNISLAALLSVVFPMAATAQTPEELDRMERALFAAAEAVPGTPEDLQAALDPILGPVEVADITDRLEDQSFGVVALTTAIQMPFEHHITCEVMDGATVREFLSAEADMNDFPDWPDVVQTLTTSRDTIQGLPAFDTLIYCSGARHFWTDDFHTDTVLSWYSALKQRLDGLDLSVTRRDPTNASYPAGGLSGTATACAAFPCVVLAGPHTAYAGGYGQVSFAVVVVDAAPAQ